MRLTVLGSQGTWPGASRECCGYLLTADGFNLWAGEAHALARELPAAEIVRTLSEEAARRLG